MRNLDVKVANFKMYQPLLDVRSPMNWNSHHTCELWLMCMCDAGAVILQNQYQLFRISDRPLEWRDFVVPSPRFNYEEFFGRTNDNGDRNRGKVPSCFLRSWFLCLCTTDSLGICRAVMKCSPAYRVLLLRPAQHTYILLHIITY